MLGRLSGRTHHVYSAVALALAEDRVLDTLNVSAVTFGEMPFDWVKQYCRGDEPMDKAGAYAVQGATAQYIRHIDGSYTGVMGLPLSKQLNCCAKPGCFNVPGCALVQLFDVCQRHRSL